MALHTCAGRGRLVTTPNSDRYKRPLLPKTKHKECRDTTPRIQCFGAGKYRGTRSPNKCVTVDNKLDVSICYLYKAILILSSAVHFIG